MCTSHDHIPGEAAQAGAGRRSFLRATALLGAAATAGSRAGGRRGRPAGRGRLAARHPQPPLHARRHARHPVPLRRAEHRQGARRGVAALSAGARAGREHRVPVPPRRPHRRTARRRRSPRSARRSGCSTGGGVGYSVLAGNHDVKSSTDDQRGRTPYLDAFGPQRFRGCRPSAGPRPDGYNTFHLFRGGRPGVAGAGAGLAAVGEGLRLGQGRPRPAPEDAGRSSPRTSWSTEDDAALGVRAAAVGPADRGPRPDLPHPQRALLARRPGDRARTRRATTSTCTSRTTRTATSAARR